MLIDEVIKLGEKNGNKICILDINNQKYSWSNYLMKTIEIASSINALNIESQPKVLIICQNKLSFFFIAMACLYINFTFIPFHLENIDLDLKHILKIITDQNCPIIFSDNLELLQKLNLNDNIDSKKKKNKINEEFNLKKIWTSNNLDNISIEESTILSWDTFIQLSQENYIIPAKNRINEIVFILHV